MIFDRFGFLQFFLRLSHWTFSTNWLFVLRYSPCRQYRKRTRFRGVHFAENKVKIFKLKKSNSERTLLAPERSTFRSKCSILGSKWTVHWTHVKWHGSWVLQLSSLDRQFAIRYDSYCMTFSKIQKKLWWTSSVHVISTFTGFDMAIWRVFQNYLLICGK